MFFNKTYSSKARTIQRPFQGLWQRVLGRIGGNAAGGGGATARTTNDAPSTNSIGLTNLGTGAELYAQLKHELENVARFQRHSAGAFGRRVEQLVEIDHGVDALMTELFQPDVAQKWQSNMGLRSAFGRRLAQISTRLAMAYRDLLDEGRRKYPTGSRGAQRLPDVACRAILHIGLSMRWHCYANKREPSTSWGRLYRLYRFAEKRGILRDKIELNGTTTTCHQEFARIILFGLGDPAGLAPEMIDVAYNWCGEWSDLVEFTSASDVEGEQHCFDMEASLPPSQFHPQMRSDRMRCFSTAAVCFKVVAAREEVASQLPSRSKANGDMRSAGNASAVADKLSGTDRDNLIRHLMSGWVKARPARRIERETDGLKVARVACGPDAINELLYAESKPDAGIPPEFSFEHWSIENESATGYGLRKKKVSEEPEAGKLVCLRANGSPIWQVGVVRWQRNAETGEPQLGIETLADNPKVVHLTLAPGTTDGLPETQTQTHSPKPADLRQNPGIATGLLPSEIAELVRRGSKFPNSDFLPDQVPEIGGTPMKRPTIKALLLPRDAARGMGHTLVISGQTFTVGTVLKISSDASANAKFWIRLSGVVDYTENWAQMNFSVMSRA
jgi:hypothetical protein